MKAPAGGGFGFGFGVGFGFGFGGLNGPYCACPADVAPRVACVDFRCTILSTFLIAWDAADDA